MSSGYRSFLIVTGASAPLRLTVPPGYTSVKCTIPKSVSVQKEFSLSTRKIEP